MFVLTYFFLFRTSTRRHTYVVDTGTHTHTHLHDFGDPFGLMLRRGQHTGEVDDVGHLLVFGGGWGD